MPEFAPPSMNPFEIIRNQRRPSQYYKCRRRVDLARITFRPDGQADPHAPPDALGQAE